MTTTLFQIDLPITKIRKSKNMMQIISSKVNQKILKAIYGNVDINVTKLHLQLKMSQSNCSARLRKLSSLGILKTRREHKKVYYSINHTKLYTLLNSIDKLQSLI